jgi:hypothetical protein
MLLAACEGGRRWLCLSGGLLRCATFENGEGVRLNFASLGGRHRGPKVRYTSRPCVGREMGRKDGGSLGPDRLGILEYGRGG